MGKGAEEVGVRLRPWEIWGLFGGLDDQDLPVCVGKGEGKILPTLATTSQVA